MLQNSARLWLEIWNRSGRGIPVATLPLAELCKAANLDVGVDFDEALAELEKVGAVIRLNPKELGELQAGRSVPGNLLAFTVKHRATFVRVDAPEVLQTRLLAQLSQVPTEGAISNRLLKLSEFEAQLSQLRAESAVVRKKPLEANKYVSEAAARSIIAKLGISPELLAEAKALAGVPSYTESDHEGWMARQVGALSWEEAIFMPGGLDALEALWTMWKSQREAVTRYQAGPGSALYKQSKEAAEQMRRVAAVLTRVLSGQPADGSREEALRAEDEVRRRAQEEARRVQEETRRAQEEAHLSQRRAELTAALEYVSKVIELWGGAGAYPQRGRGSTSEGGLWDNNGGPDQRMREPIPEAVRHEVWRRDQGRCAKCGSQEKLEFDHIIPHSKGGADTARNIQLLCERCNRIKGDLI